MQYGLNLWATIHSSVLNLIELFPVASALLVIMSINISCCMLLHWPLSNISSGICFMQGSWIVRQSVGSTPCLLGKAVDCNYIRGPQYLEVIQYFFVYLKLKI